MTTVLTERATTEVTAQPGTGLWLSAEDAHRATGWTLKPEGFCKDELCVPVPPDRATEFVRDGRVNVAGFWQHMGKPAVASASGDIWSLGESADARNDALLSLAAPDFTLPDLDSRPHSLSDFRGKRVLLATWASW
jgi:hypothetical protein